MSQECLAFEAGYTQPHLSQVENGDVWPRDKGLFSLLDVLDAELIIRKKD